MSVALPFVAVLALATPTLAAVSRWSRTALGAKFESCRVLQCGSSLVQLFWNTSSSSAVPFALECEAARAKAFVAVALDDAWFLLRFDGESLLPSVESLDASSLRVSANGTAPQLKIASNDVQRLASFELRLASLGSGRVRVMMSDAAAWDPAAASIRDVPACTAEVPQIGWANKTAYCAAPGDPPLTLSGCTSTRRLVSRNATLDQRLSVAWTIDCDAETIRFDVAVDAAVRGWFAIGWGASPDMRSADSVFFSGTTATDAFSISNSQPSIDRQQDVANVSIADTSGGRTASFTRPWDTRDADDIVLSDARAVYLLFAYHEAAADIATQHSKSGASSEPLNLFAASGGDALPLVELSSLYRELHIAVMLVVWLALPLPLIAFARFLKALGHVWFQVHRGIGFFITIAGLAGLALGVAHQEIGVRVASHFGSPHSILGIIVLALAVAQSVLGVIADRLWSPERQKTPLVPDQAHWWLGRLLWIAAIVTIFLGVERRGGDVVSYALVGVNVALQIVVFVALQFTVGTAHDADDPARTKRGCAGVIVATVLSFGLVLALLLLLLV